MISIPKCEIYYSHPYALVALLYAHYAASSSLTVYRLEEQCRAILGISGGNTKAIQRLRQELNFLEAQGLINQNVGLNQKQTLLLKSGGGGRRVMGMHPETLRLIFESGWHDIQGLALCAYFFISRLRMGTVNEATLYRAKQQLNIGHRRLRQNVDELVRLDIFRRTAVYNAKGAVRKYVLLEVRRRGKYNKPPAPGIMETPGQGCSAEQWDSLFDKIQKEYWTEKEREYGNE